MPHVTVRVKDPQGIRVRQGNGESALVPEGALIKVTLAMAKKLFQQNRVSTPSPTRLKGFTKPHIEER